MKAMAMVAHPDDCVIFAYSYIYNNPQHDWTICYLTYTAHTPRGQEIQEFWRRRNISTRFLGYEDQWDVAGNCPVPLDPEPATDAISCVIADQDLVLTHNVDGEYGHPHHVLCNKATAHHPHRVTFAGPGQGTIKYSLPAGVYDISELPLHAHVVGQFHPHCHQNEYCL